MAKQEFKFLAKQLGYGFAHVQNGLDNLGKWAFHAMKDLGDQPDTKQKKNDTNNPYIKTAKEAAKGTISFFGNLGESYLEKYEDLKRKEKSDNSRSQ